MSKYILFNIPQLYLQFRVHIDTSDLQLVELFSQGGKPLVFFSCQLLDM